jgi:hypothetical protein
MILENGNQKITKYSHKRTFYEVKIVKKTPKGHTKGHSNFVIIFHVCVICGTFGRSTTTNNNKKTIRLFFSYNRTKGHIYYYNIIIV